MKELVYFQLKVFDGTVLWKKICQELWYISKLAQIFHLFFLNFQSLYLQCNVWYEETGNLNFLFITKLSNVIGFDFIFKYQVVLGRDTKRKKKTGEEDLVAKERQTVVGNFLYRAQLNVCVHYH